MRSKHAAPFVALLVTVLVVASACGSSGRSSSSGATTSSSAASTTSAAASCAADTFAALSPAQRVGQLFAMGLANNALGPDEQGAITDAHVGTVWFTDTTNVGVSGVKAVAAAVQAQASPAATGGVRFFVGANQEGGQIQALSGPGFSTMPSAVAQGMLAPGALQQDATSWGNELMAAGVNLDFAPVLGVVPAGTESENAPIGQLQREYGTNPATVATHGTAFIKGMAAAGVTTTAKHFPGLGRVRGNTDDVAQVVDSVTTSDDPFLEGFRAGIEAGVPIVMVALATYTRIDPHHLAVFSPIVMKLLRTKMGFDGVISSDDMGAAVAVAAIPPANRAIDFISAGGDMIVSKTAGPAEAMAQALVNRAASDRAFATLVDNATRRVLAAKAAAGLLPCSSG